MRDSTSFAWTSALGSCWIDFENGRRGVGDSLSSVSTDALGFVKEVEVEIVEGRIVTRAFWESSSAVLLSIGS